MTERLLQFIWKLQYFNKNELQTTGGESLEIIYPGLTNVNQGPDFLGARIRIADKMWAGNVELHVDSSSWYKHAHHADVNYNNIILHVVWNNDTVHLSNEMATLVMEDRVSNLLLQQYESWMHNSLFIPCAQYVQGVEEIVLTSWKERLLMERLLRKTEQFRLLLYKNNFHWQETFWHVLSRNFGLYVNADAFELIARSVSFNLITKHRGQIHQLEALLMGQAGLLDGDHYDKYFLMLQKEYCFYQSKYHLQKIPLPVHFLRMRPMAFPTVRLAQLAMLLHHSGCYFSSFLHAGSIKEIRALLDTTANDYWHYHFNFEDVGEYQPKVLGKQMVNNIMVNTVLPLLFAYGHLHHEENYKLQTLDWIRCLPPEKNVITSGFSKLGITNKDASCSQSLIELKTQYCDKRCCLDCALGNTILKRKK